MPKLTNVKSPAMKTKVANSFQITEVLLNPKLYQYVNILKCHFNT